jgi:hypothetical protein
VTVGVVVIVVIVVVVVVVIVVVVVAMVDALPSSWLSSWSLSELSSKEHNSVMPNARFWDGEAGKAGSWNNKTWDPMYHAETWSCSQDFWSKPESRHTFLSHGSSVQRSLATTSSKPMSTRRPWRNMRMSSGMHFSGSVGTTS